jgi:hypothetical protein
MARRFLIGLLAVIVAVGLASFLVWRWAEGRMAQAFADWQRQMATQGWTVGAGSISRGGWPFSANLIVSDYAMTGGALLIPGGAAYTAGRIVIRLDVRQPGAVQVLASGPQSLRLSGTPALPFFADRLTVTIPVTTDRPPTNAGLDASDVRFGGLAGGLTIGLLQAQADWSGTKPTDLRVSAEAITLPPNIPAPLGPHIASATAEGSFSGSIPADAASPAQSAAGWRDSGGTVELRRIAVGWGPLGVSGNATVKLDANLQPDVTASLRLVGVEQTVAALAQAHVISARAALAARAVAGLMVDAPEDKGAAGVRVPVTLRDGTVSLGLIPLMTVPNLNWPAAP